MPHLRCSFSAWLIAQCGDEHNGEPQAAQLVRVKVWHTVQCGTKLIPAAFFRLFRFFRSAYTSRGQA